MLLLATETTEAKTCGCRKTGMESRLSTSADIEAWGRSELSRR
jgi:hypothetical protein